MLCSSNALVGILEVVFCPGLGGKNAMRWTCWRELHRHSQLLPSNLPLHSRLNKETLLLLRTPNLNGESRKLTTVSSAQIRNTFVEFFKSQNHKHIPSSSVIPKKGGGTYFVNAGMNQFKSVFLGVLDPGSELADLKRATNSQRCVRVGGKHNDLDDVGFDSYHHTFFEMLGSWSFGDYFKQKACNLAWELLTEHYKLPPQRLYVTYFGGSDRLGLPADEECRDIWLNLGVPDDRILPFGTRDNFWEMGETGPCGPCTEIHYDHIGDDGTGARLVNSDNPKVIELWNLVFMEYDRLSDGSLLRLPAQHVDTGMGLERLTAVLQGTTSNYDTDLFTPIFTAIQQFCGCRQYTGKFGTDDADSLDTAYRLVADHVRMASATITDGLLPSRVDLGSKLRQVIYRAVRAGETLGASPGLLAHLVPVVDETMGGSFPELSKKQQHVSDVISQTEERYLASKTAGRKALQNVLNQLGGRRHIMGQQMYEIHIGKYGNAISVDILMELAAEAGVTVETKELYELIEKEKETQAAGMLTNKDLSHYLDQQDLKWLHNHQVQPTDDTAKYDYTSTTDNYTFFAIPARVIGLRSNGRWVQEMKQGDSCGLLLDKTNFYSQAGGQVSDKGAIHLNSGGEVEIDQVQSAGGYVLHSGVVTADSVHVGQDANLQINTDHRTGCMKHHTATHLLNSALEKVLGGVIQQGSTVTDNKLAFDFTCSKSSVSMSDLSEICQHVTASIGASLPVYSSYIPISEALNLPGLRSLQNEDYPQNVTVVSIGHPIDLSVDTSQQALSLELCGGTHVHNTSHLDRMVVTHLQGMAQGIKRIIAVVGPPAREINDGGISLQQKLDELLTLIKQDTNQSQWAERASEIKKTLFDDSPLPRLVREDVHLRLERFASRFTNTEKNKASQAGLKDTVKQLVNLSNAHPALVENLDYKQARDVVKVLVDLSPSLPVMLLSVNAGVAHAICYVPSDSAVACEEWVNVICSHYEGNHRLPGGKLAKHTNIRLLYLKYADDPVKHDKFKQLSNDLFSSN